MFASDSTSEGFVRGNFTSFSGTEAPALSSSSNINYDEIPLLGSQERGCAFLPKPCDTGVDSMDVAVMRKTPFMILQEQYGNVSQTLVWDSRMDFATKKQVFSCKYTDPSGKVFIGEAFSKQAAKHDMAEKALAVLGQNFNQLASPTVPKRKAKFPPGGKNKRVKIMAPWQLNEAAEVAAMDTGAVKVVPKVIPDQFLKMCTERNVTPTITVSDISAPDAKLHEKQFAATIVLGEKSFNGNGPTKKLAYEAAAREVMKTEFGVDVEKMDLDRLHKELAGKAPKLALNELCFKKGLSVKFDVQSLTGGLPHLPCLYKAILTIGEQVFEGVPAPNKKEAANRATEVGLKQMFGVDVDELARWEEEKMEVADAGKNVASAKRKPIEFIPPAPKKSGEDIANDPSSLLKHPVMLLNELASTDATNQQMHAQFDFVEEGKDPVFPKRPRFTVKVTVRGQEFFGIASSKKLAKVKAARQALKVVYGIETNDPLQPTNSPIPVLAIGNHFAQLVREKYLDLCAKRSITPGKEMAGFIVSTGTAMEDAFVVSLATGTKCLNGKNISKEGMSLNDCHAEIQARRGLLKYFYSQLKLLGDSSTKDSSIFELAKSGVGYKLKSNVKVHLFITSAPCGDARIFSPMDEANPTIQSDLRPNRKNRGNLRVKIEDGMGTIPVTSSSVPQVQTWDAIMGGQRMVCMSCSDKVLRWNVLGVQGALLSNLLAEPIYMTTLVLGSLFHLDHLVRSCFARIAPFLTLSDERYSLNQPVVSGISDSESRTTLKAPNTAFNWVLSEPDVVEEICQETGRASADQQPSRLCKQNLFRDFAAACSFLKHAGSSSLYVEAKEKATSYQKVKEKFFMALQESEMGQWVKKPVEMDDFELHDISFK